MTSTNAMTERLREPWRRWRLPILLGLSAVGVVAVPYIVWINRAKPTFLGFDAYAYWSLDLSDPYGVQYMNLGSFRYTPAFAQAFSWLGLLPWELYLGLMLAGMLAILVAWGRTWALALIAFQPVALELYHGNIDLFMAYAMVVGLVFPVAWVFVLLSKVTPGIALLWFVGRRDWRSLAIALGATAAVAAISFAIAPDLWAQWIQAMRDSLSFVPPRPYPIPIPFLVRAPIAAAIALWGGHTNRSWTIPVAAVIALPVVWIPGLSMLVAVIPLWRRDRAARTAVHTTISPLTPSTTLVSSGR